MTQGKLLEIGLDVNLRGKSRRPWGGEQGFQLQTPFVRCLAGSRATGQKTWDAPRVSAGVMSSFRRSVSSMAVTGEALKGGEWR